MTINTPEQELAALEDIVTSIRNSLGALRRDIESLSEQAKAGGGISETKAAQSLRFLSGLVAACHSAELKLHVCKQHQSASAEGGGGGGAGGQSLDLDAARAAIGCQLDRLRCACDTGEIPE